MFLSPFFQIVKWLVDTIQPNMTSLILQLKTAVFGSISQIYLAEGNILDCLAHFTIPYMWFSR